MRGSSAVRRRAAGCCAGAVLAGGEGVTGGEELG